MDLIRKDEYKVLGVTGFAEFCERYSYYVIQGLLIFYLIDKYNLGHEKSQILVGTVLGVIYVSALVGGYIADKIIGKYMAATFGSLLMLSGCFILSISNTEKLLYLGLSFIALSTGLVKSNMSSIIGGFYDKAKLPASRRDFGFNVFYVMINLGGFVALFLASSIKEQYGDAAPFYSSVFVTCLLVLNMLIGGIFIRKYIDKPKYSLVTILKLIIICGMYIGLVYFILANSVVANWAMLSAIVLCIGVLISACKTDKRRIMQACCFFSLSIIYWALYFQIFISLELFIEKCVNNNLLGFVLNPSQYIAMNSVGVMILGALVGQVWYQLGKKGHEVSDVLKFGVAFISIAAFFGVLYLLNVATPLGTKLPSFAIILVYGSLLPFSELALSAVGLSLMTKIAPEGFVSRYLAIWMVTLGLGGKLGGMLASYISIEDNIDISRVNMGHGFVGFIGLAVLSAILCVGLRKFLK